MSYLHKKNWPSKLNDAKDIVDSRGLLYDEVLRVKYENHDIKLTSEEFEKLLTI